MEIISLLHAGKTTLDTWTVLMNQEIKMFPPHTPRHTAISILLYLHVDVRGFLIPQGKKFRYSLNYSEKQVRKAALGIVHENMTIIIPPKKKAMLELLPV